ncbi:hypothetical protein PPERSA_09100 [Pseudocohnilembus persalinus]|uniref:Uncharacterized protein n=1 Tax=Pseudocohnilembus persalinus TaxID=266149 RepID=A0A0V0QXA4_PSEPJ|nr:hypothetical protein PPERSA_09100 [Pseudocohnilembus persalinus]|eukprot:KRX06698.1 hypothetical protein PPERSA_09100 [Pseudocohnilembus persalinus]
MKELKEERENQIESQKNGNYSLNDLPPFLEEGVLNTNKKNNWEKINGNCVNKPYFINKTKTIKKEIAAFLQGNEINKYVTFNSINNISCSNFFNQNNENNFLNEYLMEMEDRKQMQKSEYEKKKNIDQQAIKMQLAKIHDGYQDSVKYATNFLDKLKNQDQEIEKMEFKKQQLRKREVLKVYQVQKNKYKQQWEQFNIPGGNKEILKQQINKLQSSLANPNLKHNFQEYFIQNQNNMPIDKMERQRIYNEYNRNKDFKQNIEKYENEEINEKNKNKQKKVMIQSQQIAKFKKSINNYNSNNNQKSLEKNQTINKKNCNQIIEASFNVPCEKVIIYRDGNWEPQISKYMQEIDEKLRDMLKIQKDRSKLKGARNMQKYQNISDRLNQKKILLFEDFNQIEYDDLMKEFQNKVGKTENLYDNFVEILDVQLNYSQITNFVKEDKNNKYYKLYDQSDVIKAKEENKLLAKKYWTFEDENENDQNYQNFNNQLYKNDQSNFLINRSKKNQNASFQNSFLSIHTYQSRSEQDESQIAKNLVKFQDINLSKDKKINDSLGISKQMEQSKQFLVEQNTNIDLNNLNKNVNDSNMEYRKLLEDLDSKGAGSQQKIKLSILQNSGASSLKSQSFLDKSFYSQQSQKLNEFSILKDKSQSQIVEVSQTHLNSYLEQMRKNYKKKNDSQFDLNPETLKILTDSQRSFQNEQNKNSSTFEQYNQQPKQVDPVYYMQQEQMLKDLIKKEIEKNFQPQGNPYQGQLQQNNNDFQSRNFQTQNQFNNNNYNNNNMSQTRSNNFFTQYENNLQENDLAQKIVDSVNFLCSENRNDQKNLPLKFRIKNKKSQKSQQQQLQQQDGNFSLFFVDQFFQNLKFLKKIKVQDPYPYNIIKEVEKQLMFNNFSFLFQKLDVNQINDDYLQLLFILCLYLVKNVDVNSVKCKKFCFKKSDKNKIQGDFIDVYYETVQIDKETQISKREKYICQLRLVNNEKYWVKQNNNCEEDQQQNNEYKLGNIKSLLNVEQKKAQQNIIQMCYSQNLIFFVQNFVKNKSDFYSFNNNQLGFNLDIIATEKFKPQFKLELFLQPLIELQEIINNQNINLNLKQNDKKQVIKLNECIDFVRNDLGQENLYQQNLKIVRQKLENGFKKDYGQFAILKEKIQLVEHLFAQKQNKDMKKIEEIVEIEIFEELCKLIQDENSIKLPFMRKNIDMRFFQIIMNFIQNHNIDEQIRIENLEPWNILQQFNLDKIFDGFNFQYIKEFHFKLVFLMCLLYTENVNQNSIRAEKFVPKIVYNQENQVKNISDGYIDIYYENSDASQKYKLELKQQSTYFGYLADFNALNQVNNYCIPYSYGQGLIVHLGGPFYQIQKSECAQPQLDIEYFYSQIMDIKNYDYEKYV